MQFLLNNQSLELDEVLRRGCAITTVTMHIGSALVPVLHSMVKVKQVNLTV